MAPSPQDPDGATPATSPDVLTAPTSRPRPHADECVIVVHGLWLHGFVMARFCARLRAAGFRTATFSYPSMRRGAEDNAESLARFISKVKAVRIHVVAHSLGGLIALLYAHGRPDARLSRLVLLGSPVSGSAVAARLASSRLGRLFLGQARAALTAGVRPPLPAYLAIGVIAGTLGFGLGRLVMPLRGQHDGTVQVEETRLPEATDMITLPVTHTGMMFSARVADAVCAFLAGGRFPRELR